MTAGLAILIVCLGVVLGYIAARFEDGAPAERWSEKPGPHGQPMSNCRLVRPTPLFDQELAP